MLSDPSFKGLVPYSWPKWTQDLMPTLKISNIMRDVAQLLFREFTVIHVSFDFVKHQFSPLKDRVSLDLVYLVRTDTELEGKDKTFLTSHFLSSL